MTELKSDLQELENIKAAAIIFIWIFRYMLRNPNLHTDNRVRIIKKMQYY